MMATGRLPAERRHTLLFLRFARAASPVFLDTEVDMTRVKAHRAEALDRGQRYSVVSYVIHAAAKAFVRHPHANSAMGSGLYPRVIRYPFVDAKLALDKRIAGERVVVAGLIAGADTCSLSQIQAQVDRYKSNDVDGMPEFRGIRLLHRLPAWLGWLAFRLSIQRLRRRGRVLGTFAVSSLGHRPINGFHAVGGTAVTLNLGQVRDAAVVQQGALAVAPMMRLNLTFDHRLIDGAAAADLLADIKSSLECAREFGELAP
jgi:pyruvate/2-oxoglutarate dehydrogenase complex dihydrolipoamide acyltransferase (E2) component